MCTPTHLLRPSLIPSALLLIALTGCRVRSTVESLPISNPQSISHRHLLLGKEWLKEDIVHHHDGYTLIFSVTKRLLPEHHQLHVQLLGKPYRTTKGKAWTQPLAIFTKPDTHTIHLNNEDLRTVDGPYDYCQRFTLLQPDGQCVESHENRLIDHIPAPGVEGAYEHENREELKHLQNAAANCSTITFTVDTLNAEVAPIGQSSPLTLSLADATTVRKLIARMRSVKTETSCNEYDQFQILSFLDSTGKELASLNLIHVTREAFVSPENVAYDASFALSNDDYAILGSLLKRLHTTPPATSHQQLATSN